MRQKRRRRTNEQADDTEGGERFDPTAGENDLARTVLTRSVNEFTYNYTGDEELSNTVCAVIRP